MAAFECGGELNGHVTRYRHNRNILFRGVSQVGITNIALPDGALYLYGDISDLTQDSLKFCHRLLSNTGIAVTPSVDFDPTHGTSKIRFSFAARRVR